MAAQLKLVLNKLQDFWNDVLWRCLSITHSSTQFGKNLIQQPSSLVEKGLSFRLWIAGWERWISAAKESRCWIGPVKVQMSAWLKCCAWMDAHRKVHQSSYFLHSSERPQSHAENHYFNVMLLKEALQSQDVLRTSVLVHIMFNYRFAFCLHKPLQLIGRDGQRYKVMVLLPVVSEFFFILAHPSESEVILIIMDWYQLTLRLKVSSFNIPTCTEPLNVTIIFSLFLSTWPKSPKLLRFLLYVLSLCLLQNSSPDGLVSILKRRRASLDGLPPPSNTTNKQTSKRKVRFSEPEDGSEHGTVRASSAAAVCFR